MKDEAKHRGAHATLKGGLSEQPRGDALEDPHRLDTAKAEEDYRIETIEKSDGDSADEQGLCG